MSASCHTKVQHAERLRDHREVQLSNQTPFATRGRRAHTFLRRSLQPILAILPSRHMSLVNPLAYLLINFFLMKLSFFFFVHQCKRNMLDGIFPNCMWESFSCSPRKRNSLPQIGSFYARASGFFTSACTPTCIINYALQHVHPRHRTHTGTPCRHRSTFQHCV